MLTTFKQMCSISAELSSRSSIPNTYIRTRLPQHSSKFNHAVVEWCKTHQDLLINEFFKLGSSATLISRSNQLRCFVPSLVPLTFLGIIRPFYGKKRPIRSQSFRRSGFVNTDSNSFLLSRFLKRLLDIESMM